MSKPLLNFEYPPPKTWRNHLSKALRDYKSRQYKKRTDQLVKTIVDQGVCVFGPFIGELGHLLAHNLPLVTWLKAQGVKVHFVGFEKFEAFLYDSTGEPLYEQFYPLRDFGGETSIKSNFAEEFPADVAEEWNRLKSSFAEKGWPTWYLEDETEYWYEYRKWLYKSDFFQVSDLSQVYGKREPGKKVCSVFVRFRPPDNPVKLAANGPLWDYEKLVEALLDVYDEINLVGSPHQSIDSFSIKDERVKWRVSHNNREILQLIGSSDMMITPHSGAMYLSAYFTAGLTVIYHGIRDYSEIADVHSTLAYLHKLNPNINTIFAFSNTDIKDKLIRFHETT
ncbi:hypothetical protein KFE98_00825 [bacterium SCSIO 12741]|nr:hypothetical protein KFE98_00825 [bacterium SCSIO 12741]